VLGDLTRSDAAHHDEHDDGGCRADDESSQKIDSQFSLKRLGFRNV
jgi:hypothetical protein